MSVINQTPDTTLSQQNMIPPDTETVEVKSGPLPQIDTAQDQLSGSIPDQEPAQMALSGQSVPSDPASDIGQVAAQTLSQYNDSPQPVMAPAAPSVAAGKPSMFEGLLKGALFGMGAAMVNDPNSFSGGMGRAMVAQQGVDQQNTENQQKQQMLDIERAKQQSDALKDASQIQLNRANAGKAVVDLLHTEAIVQQMPQTQRDEVAKALGSVTDAYIKAGYTGVEIDDTPEARTAYLQQMQQSGTNMEDVIFSYDPTQGKILAFRPDPSKRIQADDVVAVGKQLGLNLPHRDMDPQVFNSITSGAVKLQAQKMSDSTRIQAAGIQAGATIGAAGIKANADMIEHGLGPAGNGQSLVDAIGTGHIAPDRLGYLLARNPALVASVVQKYPNFDAAKAASYAATYKDYTSGKTSVALNAGNTALQHLYELSQLNTPISHIPHTPEWTAYQNKANTVASELAKFYGDTTIPAIAKLEKTLTSTLPGNRMAAIQTQAKSMGDKLDNYEQQWKNAAPSRAYEAPMPKVSNAGLAARAALDPAYRQRITAQSGSRGNQSSVAPEGTRALVNNHWQTKHNGKWVSD